MAKTEAVAATVTGDDQKVGFRAAVMKQAIEYNLAGSAENQPNNVVHFTLQGDAKRIDAALATIRDGTKRSSGIEIATAPAAVDPALKGFTIVGWTSSSRDISNAYDLVFELRHKDEEISPKDVKAKWREILESTLSAEDRKKLAPED